MRFFDRLRVGSKLLLLAGVPVLGILALSALVVLDVRERAQAAAGLGTVEDLAQLTEKMLEVIGELQWERAETTYQAGREVPDGAALQRQQRRTDGALRELSEFLRERDEAKLPDKLRQDLKAARQKLQGLAVHRKPPNPAQFELLAYLEFFASVNDSLIQATAALTQLSEDKQLLLGIGGLVSAMQVSERKAREHALLNYVFGKQEFPPGTFRYLVTLLTEQEVYTNSLRTWANEEEFTRLRAALRGPRASEIEAMRQIAVETTEGAFDVDAAKWFEVQHDNMRALAGLTRGMVESIRVLVSRKMDSTSDAVRLATGLVLGVVAISLLLGWAIARGLTRSVRGLALVAKRVHDNHDFAIRAEKTSADELGLLTDAFNGMLAGIQERDRELEAHRQNLEALVEERTRELSERNEAMRLVLDNVDQGLAMIDREGKLLGEYSRAFERAFGEPAAGTPFYAVLGRDDDKKSFELEAGYEQLMADVLPVELALDQLPKRIVHDGRHYAVKLQPILHGRELHGALLVTRDITSELLAQRHEAQQRERVQIFERIMRDRTGFQEFVAEARRLMASVRAGDHASETERMRTLHTLKGVTAVFEASSVSEAAHELEQAFAQHEPEFVRRALSVLSERWDAFEALVRPILGEESSSVVVSTDELEELIDEVRRGVPHPALLTSLAGLKHELVAQRFHRISDQLTRVARRLGKPEPRIVVEAGRVRLPAARFREFWSSLAHVVRNIVDHGLQAEAERVSQGKPRENRVELRARSDARGICVEIADDGAGIDWQLIAAKAKERGLPAETDADLVDALFADGLSTARDVSHTSGRGIGMPAVRAACRALGASVQVESQPGQGTRMRFIFPAVPAAELGPGVGLANVERAAGQRDSQAPAPA